MGSRAHWLNIAEENRNVANIATIPIEVARDPGTHGIIPAV